MKGFVKTALLGLCFLIALPFVIEGQNKKELEKKKQKLQKEIDETNRLLKETSKNKKLTSEQVSALKRKIQLRKEMIAEISQEMQGIESEIGQTGTEINDLEKKLSQLKEEYANMIRFAQRNKSSYQRLMFVFASDDFNQAYKRLVYLRQYSEHRRQQAELISGTRKKLDEKRTELQSTMDEKQNLMDSELDQKTALEQDKKQQDKILTNLQQREEKLKKQLAEKQRAKKKLDKAIDDLVRKEIEAAKKKASAAGKKNVTTENVFTLTPEAQKLSAGFSNNRGRLPWPVEKGRISERFGEHPHPELKGVKVYNNGVDIRSVAGSRARAIFEGEVTGVINIPGANSAVIIRHGEYLSVYSNLETVSVKKGDKVSTKQSIGKVYTDPETGFAEVHLEIWKGTQKMDPSGWLSAGG
jgi:septal ring factor EnvC (AmiA/AmiB activator)